MSKKYPNIILIYTDQQRYDTVGVNGNDLIYTPNIDKLAREGVQFKRSYTTTPLCVPSRVALFTGRYDHTNLSYNNNRLMMKRETDFVSLLRKKGYKTGLSGKDHCFGNRLNEAFDWFKLADHLGFKTPMNACERKMREFRKENIQKPYAVDPIDPEENLTAKIIEASTEFISENRDNPFFLWVSLPDPHPPYLAPEPYASMYKGVDIPPPAWREDEMVNKPYRQQLVVSWNRYGEDYPEEKDIIRLKEIYWGSISYIDHEIGKLMSFLKKNNLEEDTIIVFTSDHGDYMGDHRMIRKGPHLYEALVHVPLIISWPGKLKPKVTDAMVSNIDIFPTLFDLLSIEYPSYVQGESFSNVLYGRSNCHRNMIFMEYGDEGSVLKFGELTSEQEEFLKNSPDHHLCDEIRRGRTKAVRTNRWKYCITPGDVDELYDLIEDPDELTNLADSPDYKDIIRELRNYILEWLIETEDTLNN